MIARLKCWLWGHKRGKRIFSTGGAIGTEPLPNEAMYQCPRCKATWTRKVKA